MHSNDAAEVYIMLRTRCYLGTTCCQTASYHKHIVQLGELLPFVSIFALWYLVIIINMSTNCGNISLVLRSHGIALHSNLSFLPLQTPSPSSLCSSDNINACRGVDRWRSLWRYYVAGKHKMDEPIISLLFP